MTVKETLVKARALIADEANWKQGGIAENVGGKPAAPFCALGAIGKASGTLAMAYGAGRDGSGGIGALGNAFKEKNNANEGVQATRKEAQELLESCLPAPIHEYNDSHDHDCVIAAFDAAIERAGELEKAAA